MLSIMPKPVLPHIGSYEADERDPPCVVCLARPVVSMAYWHFSSVYGLYCANCTTKLREGDPRALATVPGDPPRFVGPE
jgi:hypothetical protein